MSGIVKLAKIAASTPRMTATLPGLPQQGTLMVRLIRLASAAVTEFFEPQFRVAGIAENPFHILCLLSASEHGTASPGELAEMVGTSRANITRLLDQMEQKDWIRRETSLLDARRQIVTVTPSGRSTVDATIPRISNEIEIGFNGLTPAEMDQLEGLLKKLVVSMDPAVSTTVTAA